MMQTNIALVETYCNRVEDTHFLMYSRKLNLSSTPYSFVSTVT